MKRSLFALALLANLIPAGAKPDTAPVVPIAWTESTPAPEPRAGYAAGTLGGKLILIGGTFWHGSKGNWTQKEFTAATHAFDPFTGAWEKLADAPVSLGYAAYEQVNNKIFVLGGLQDGQASDAVHTLTKRGSKYEWGRGPKLPTPRLFAAAVAVGSTLYLIGGTSVFEPFDAIGTCCLSKTATNTVWMLDVSDPSKTWVPLPNFPGEPRWGHAAVSDGRAIYVFGGRYQALKSDPVKKFNEVLRFDVASRKWSRIADMPETLQGAPLVYVNGRILLIASDRVAMSFDPATSQFSSATGLPQDAYVDYFAWMDPLLVGASGENKIDSPRRRSPWTFVGRLGAGASAAARK